MNKRIVFAILMIPVWASAQVKIKGDVKDDKVPLAGANVILTSPDGKIITGNMTREDGTFEMAVRQGSYKISISLLGFTNWQRDVSLEKDSDLGVILLKRNAGKLSEVVITARKKLITYQPDRLVFDVENSVSAIGGNAVSAISAAPGVTVLNNSIRMLGKGSSRVMVNGRVVDLSGEDLLNYLKSIAASDISTIEVITNPPAKYEAGGEGGLININLKKGKADSWKNSTTLSYDQNAYDAYTLQNNYLYNKNRIRFAFNIGGKLGDTKIKQNLDTYYPGPWKMKYEGKQKEDNLSGRMALDYDLSPGTAVGIQYLGNANYPGSDDITNTEIRNAASNIDSLLINTGHRGLSSASHTYNAHLISVLDTLNRKISVDLDYFNYDTKTDNNFVAKTYLQDGQFLNTNLSARNVSNQNIDNYSAKIDMEHPLKFVNLSYGARVSVIKSKADILYYNTLTGADVLDPDPNRSNTFEYLEDNQAVYLSGARNMHDKLSLQVGLRLENTRTKGYSGTLNQTNINRYLKLFPTLYVSYKQNENHSFLLNYGKRINRPGFALLNPFRSYINSNSYSEGNPFLQPSFSDNFDFTHVYKGSLRTNVLFNMTTNGFGPIFTSSTETNTLIINRQNYFKEYNYGIGESYSADIAAWWQSNNSLYFLSSKSKLENNIGGITVNSGQLYLSTNNTFSLNKLARLQIDYTYRSPFKKGLYEFGYVSGLNIAFKQTLLKNNMQLSVLVNDVFNTAYLKDYTSVVNSIKQVYSENNSSRFFRFSLTYNFGNKKVDVKQRGFGNDEERKRTN